MDNLIERVARAIAGEGVWMEYDCPRDEYRREARAAIEAMREPTKEMLKAGKRDDLIINYGEPTPNVEDIWKSMIEAALVSRGDR